MVLIKTKLSEATYQSLVKHLAYVRENKNRIIGEYFADSSLKLNEFQNLFGNYIEELDKLIKNASTVKTTDERLPFVVIGSEVEVEELDSNKTYKFRIISSFSDKNDYLDISFLSPVGSSLLLKKVGDKVPVEAPKGVFYYKVKSITFLPDSDIS
mgnify:CR=1 FL=1